MALQQWKGEWIVGEEGADKVSILCDDLDQQVDTDEQLFQPWMSLPAPHRELASRVSFPISDDGSKIVRRESDLEILRSAFAADDLPLGALKWEGTNLHVMTAPEVGERSFEKRFAAALDLIARVNPSMRARYETLVRLVVPLVDRDTTKTFNRGSGISSHLYRGGVLVALPTKLWSVEVDLAINLCHEVGHQALMIYQHADPLLASDPNEMIFSAVRKTIRPALMSYHGMVALAYMVEFLLAMLKREGEFDSSVRDRIRVKATELVGDLDLGLSALNMVRLTELGELIRREAYTLLNSAQNALALRSS